MAAVALHGRKEEWYEVVDVETCNEVPEQTQKMEERKKENGFVGSPS